MAVNSVLGGDAPAASQEAVNPDGSPRNLDIVSAARPFRSHLADCIDF